MKTMNDLNDASYNNTLIDISKDYYGDLKYHILKDIFPDRYYDEAPLLELRSFRNYRLTNDLELLICYGDVHRPDTLIRQSRSNSFINMNDMSAKSLICSLESLKNTNWRLIEL